MSKPFEDLLKDSSESFENGNYFVVTVTDLDPNRTYPIQFKWKYKDGTSGKDWSAVKSITTPGESAPNTPSFINSDVDVSQPEKIIITYRGLSDESTPSQITNIDRVDIYINGAPFDGSKPTDNFKEPGTKVIPAPAGTYTIVLYAISKLGAKSPVSSPVTKTVVAAGEVIEAPTNPNGFSSRRILAGVEVSWAGTYANGTFSGFEAIKIFAGTSASATVGTYTEVGVLTGNNVKNTIVVPVDGVYVKYDQAVYIHAAAVNKNGTVGTIQENVTNQTLGPGKATDADINDGAIVISKLASDVLTVGNLKAGDINATSYIRAGTAGSARVEISSSTVGSVLPGLTVYASDGTTQLLRAPLTGGLTINGGGTFTGDLSAGTGNSIFKADSSGIYLGNADYASAPFSVSRNGVLKAISGTIGGWTLGSTFFQGNNIKLDTGQIIIGSTASSYFDMTPSSITHRNSNGTASGKFTLTLGASPQLTIDGALTINGSSVATSTDLTTGLNGKVSNGQVSNDSSFTANNIVYKINGNTNTTTIDGGKITTGTVVAGSVISTWVYAGTINANNITSGTITGREINNGSGTFRVTSAGALTASSADITGKITGTSGQIGPWYITSTGIQNTDDLSPTVRLVSSTSLNFSLATNKAILAKEMQLGTQSANGGLGNGQIILNGSNLTPALGVTGTTDLTGALLVSGSITAGTVGSQFEFLSSGGNVRVAQTYNNVVSLSPRTMSVNSNGLYGYVSSTIRHKKNINDYIVDEESLMSLNVKSFSYKNDETNSVHYGFIAEDALDLGLEELIQMDKDGLPEYFDYSRLSVFLFQVVKTQKNKIIELEQRLDALEG